MNNFSRTSSFRDMPPSPTTCTNGGTFLPIFGAENGKNRDQIIPDAALRLRNKFFAILDSQLSEKNNLSNAFTLLNIRKLVLPPTWRSYPNILEIPWTGSWGKSDFLGSRMGKVSVTVTDNFHAFFLTFT